MFYVSLSARIAELLCKFVGMTTLTVPHHHSGSEWSRPFPTISHKDFANPADKSRLVPTNTVGT